VSKDLSFGPVERVDFVVAFQPENIVALRYSDANALRKACAFLRWIWTSFEFKERAKLPQQR
jgi:hypothetical protein